VGASSLVAAVIRRGAADRGLSDRSSQEDSMARREKLISVPLDEMFPTTDAQRTYWQLLGRLVDMVTIVEEILNMVVLKYSKVNLSTARALFLPLRIDVATNTLHKLIETKHLKSILKVRALNN
jgi:hypothetical protein